ncbi:MAG: NAD(+) synthase [Mesorhizobium sp.]|nr:MAG: NAD(+) synthase [Mesorhizobium sp.]
MSVRPGDDAQAILAQGLAIDPGAETDRIVTALRQQLRGIRKRGLVLGLSGGIDSSVSVALAARAVGPQNVLCLFMPENDSDPESLRLGRLVAGTFGVDSIVEDIGPTLRAMGCYQRRDAFIRELVPDYGEGWASKIVIANALEHEGYNISSLVVQDPGGKQTKLRMPLPVYLGMPEEIRSRPPTTDTYSLAQTQEEFYFSLPYDRMDLCLCGLNNGVAAEVVGQAAGLDASQVERVWADIAAKRKATRYLHLRPQLVDEVEEIST